MNKKLLVASMLSVMSLGASAETPSFSSIEVGYTTQENDFVDGDYTGYEAAASYQVSDNFYLAAKQINTSEDSFEISTSTFGVGYLHSIGESSAMYAQVDYAAVFLERASSGDFDEQGVQLAVGVKSKVLDSFELDVSLRMLDAGEVDPSFGDYQKHFILIGLDYHLSNDFSIYTDYENEKDSERYSFGVKYNF
jgi:hypothetical protein